MQTHGQAHAPKDFLYTHQFSHDYWLKKAHVMHL